MSKTQDEPTSMIDAFAELAGISAGDQPLNDVLERTAQLATMFLPGSASSSVTLIGSDKATTAAFTGKVALDLDETQYALGYGPCLAAAEAGQIIAVPDWTAETRWPEFARATADRGVRSSLSVPLPVQRQVIGALNLYTAEVGSFDDNSVTLAERFGAYAAVAIANTRLYMSSAELAEQMAEAMRSRATIEQAKGILMAQRNCAAEEAFNILVDLSQRSHRKLRDVAQTVVEATLAE